MPKRILVITGDAGESYECLYARHRLLEAGLVPVIAAPSKRRLHLVIHDFEQGWDTYVERQGYGAESDLTFDDVKVDEYGAVLYRDGARHATFPHGWRLVTDRSGVVRSVLGVVDRAVAGTLVTPAYRVELTVSGNEEVSLDDRGGVVDRVRVPVVRPAT